MSANYKRQPVEKYIIKALQTLGGSASRQAIKEEIVADEDIDITYENVFVPIQSKKGTAYIPFTMDFNFGLVNILTCGYIQNYSRGSDITLTEKGRTLDYNTFPSDEDKKIIDEYWAKKYQDRIEKKKSLEKNDNEIIDDADVHKKVDEVLETSESSENWKIEILEK